MKVATRFWQLSTTEVKVFCVKTQELIQISNVPIYFRKKTEMSGLWAALVERKRKLHKSNFWEQSLLNPFDGECGNAWVYLGVAPVKHVDKSESVVKTAVLGGVLAINV